MLRGIGTSKGIGIGHALVLKNVECEVRHRGQRNSDNSSIFAPMQYGDSTLAP